MGWSCPAVSTVEGHTTIGCLGGSGGLCGFDEWADIAETLSIMLGCGGSRDRKRLRLCG